MPITYIKKDTASDIASNSVLNETAGTSATATATAGSNGFANVYWISELDQPNILTWQDGIYTWRVRITTANTAIVIDLVAVRRYNSSGTMIAEKQVFYGSGSTISCGTTGVKSDTIIWDDGTQNPAGAAATDRFGIRIRFLNTVTMNQTVGFGMNLTSGNDEINTPLVAGGGGGEPAIVAMTVTSKVLQNKFIVKV